MKYRRRVINKQHAKVSGMCDFPNSSYSQKVSQPRSQGLSSYLPHDQERAPWHAPGHGKTSDPGNKVEGITENCNVQYGDVILEPVWGTPTSAGNQCKHLEFTLALSKRLFSLLTLRTFAYALLSTYWLLRTRKHQANRYFRARCMLPRNNADVTHCEKSASRFALVRFWNYSRNYCLNCTPLGPITICKKFLNHTHIAKLFLFILTMFLIVNMWRAFSVTVSVFYKQNKRGCDWK